MIRRFNRYELKYVVDAAVRDRLLPQLSLHMSPDREGSEDGTYRVNSLYHDTFDLRCYRAKLDGLNYRRKLRIRRYGSMEAGLEPVVMVEIKQRINRTTQKRRIAMPLEDAYALCDGRLDPSFSDPLDQSVAEEVSYLVGSLQLGPKCVISYRRRALVGSRYEPGLRVTFDEDLQVSDASRGVEEGAERYRFLPADKTILEVKTNDVVPIWLSRLLAAHACTLSRYSKYCAGIAHLRGPVRHARAEKDNRWTS